MSKKKIITLALVAMIAILSITSASLAYFTDTKTAENTFTMGNVKIVLDETDVTNPNGDRVTENEYDVYPVYVHAISDGRDTKTMVAYQYIKEIKAESYKFHTNNFSIGTDIDLIV